MVTGSIRRKVEDTKPINFEDIALKCLDLDPRDSCLIALLYLSGRRVCEVLGLQKKDFKIEEKRISFQTFNEKVFRKNQQSDFTMKLTIDRQRALKDKDNKIIYPKQYEKYRDELYFQKIRPHWRTDTDSGKALTVFVTERVGSLADSDYLFQRERWPESKPIGRFMAYKIVRFNFPDIWPHFLRHERFTEVAKVYRNDPVAMHRFTYHRRFESTLQYIRNLEEEKI